MKNKNRFRGFVMKLFILCLITGFATVAAPLFSAEAQTVTIPDANLRTALESALNKAAGDAITEAELGGLRQLDARNSSITTLTGMEKATALRSINLKGNSVSDISPVVNLPRLRLLNVENNPLNYASLNTHIPAIERAMANRNNARVTYTARTPTTLTKVSGDSQTSELSATLANPFVVEVKDGANPAAVFAGVPVTFAVTAGGGTISATTVSTDATGRAETTLTLGATSVGAHTVDATVEGIAEKVTFTATVSQVATTLVKISGDSQTADPGVALANAFVVEVRDQAGTAMSNVSVTFAVTAGGGSLSTTTATTGTNGQAETTLTLGTTVVGANTVEATVAGITEKITFTGTANQVATTLVKVSGDSQTGNPGVALSNAFVVEVQDQAGSAMPDVSVAFSVTAGGGSLSAASATTNASGQAETTLTLGATVVGANTVEATVASITEKITFTGTANQVATTLVKVSGDSQTAAPGAALSNAFVVEVRDQAGSAMSGVSVAFSVTAGGGSLSAASATTNASGQAETTLTLGATATGASTVDASVAGITEKITFTATANQVATTLVKVSGDSQTGNSGVALSNAFVVEVQDQAGTAMSDVSVTFAVTAGNGSLSATTATTGTNGQAETTLTLGATALTHTVEATVVGITEKATFSATATAVATSLEIVSGNNQSGDPGVALANAFVVEVKNQAGTAMSDVSVTFAVTAGGGSLSAATATTGTTGQAETTLTLGATVVGTNTVEASVSGITTQATFTATANRKATTLVVISGNNQNSSPHWEVSDALVVEVRDQAGDAMSGVDVTFRVTAGGGGLSDDTSGTSDTSDTAGAAGAAGAGGAAGAAGAAGAGDAVDITQPVPTPSTTTTIASGTDGQAEVSFFLGAAAGTHTVEASVPQRAAQVSFSVTGASSPTVTISDNNLLYIINLHLRIRLRQFGRAFNSPVTEADMALIRTLNVVAGTRAVSNLTGLEKAVNMSRLASGPYNTFTDLSPLEDLRNLATVTLVKNPISDLSDFSNSGKFRALTHLNLSGTRVTNLTPLKNLTNLRRLFLNNTSVSDISQLESLFLWQLELENASVSDISKLPSTLNYLVLKGNSIKVISSLLNLRSLLEVSLENNPLCHRALLDVIPELIRRLGAANVTYTAPSQPIHRPVFSSSNQVSVAENTATSTAFHTVTATDADTEDSITGYTITGGADKTAFDLDESTGALSFKASPDYENPTDNGGDRGYVIIVQATSGEDCRELDASQTITITVTDQPPPSAPAAPTITAAVATPTSLTVNWNAPTNTGPAITDYDVRYREGTTGTFTDVEHTGTATTATITGLTAGTSYQVQVLAKNAEGTGSWSASGSGTTEANVAPTFTSTTTAFSVAENTTAVTTVTATDADASDPVTYALSGADSAAFSISTAGALTFSTAPDFENPTDVQSTAPVNAAANNVYLVKVTATGGTGARALDVSKTLIVTVTDADEPPAKPDAPTVAAATAASHTSLDVNWTAPNNDGKPDITDYDVQYREGTTGTFTAWAHTGIATTATITGLKPNTSYQVQVRAKNNDEGTGPWSDAGTGKTDYQPEDVNKDDEVDVADLIAIGTHIGGTTNPAHEPDVNNDGTVNSADSQLVARAALNNSNALTDIDGDDDVDVDDLVAFAATPVDVNGDTTADDEDIKLIARLALNAGNGNAAPAHSQTHAALNFQNLQHLVHQALQRNRFDATYRRGVAALERILESLMIPEESALLHNYPNPFNPETWIPYQLASAAEVTLTLYDVTGRVVRTLNLGHQDAGMYRSKSRAAYWDGRNAQDEPVASGVYFYTLVAGEFTATGKMLIRK